MNSTLDYLLYTASVISFTFWIVIWIMHACAITNAKLKLNKRSYTLAASKRKRKLKHIRDKYYHNNNHHHQVDKNHLKNNKSSPLCSPSPAAPTFALTPHEHTDVSSNKISNNSNTFNPPPHHHHQINSFTYFNYKTNTTTNDNNNNTKDSSSQHILRDINKENDSTHTINLYNALSYHFNLPLPGVSIIKPLVGIDTNLHLNLETFFQMDYPIYELLFCVQDPNDEAVLVVKNLLKTYPNVDAKLFIGGERVGVNPKINNMQPAYKAVKYELLLISDSGILMKKDTLLDMVSHMHDDVALVHQMPFVCDSGNYHPNSHLNENHNNNHNQNQNFQSIVEKVYFGTAHARAYLTADLLSINCPTGMSALMRKQLLDEVGGIKAFGQYLAEDFFFAKSFTNRGWKICLSSQPAWQNSANSSDTLKTLNCRIERWIKLRLAMVPQWTILEPFSECMLLGFLGSISINFLLALDPSAIFIFHVFIWFSCDYNLLCIIQNGPLTFSKTDFLIAWLIRECTALIIFLKAILNPKVTWRSRIFKLKWGGYAEEIFAAGEKGPIITKQHCHTNEANLLCALDLYYVTC